MFLERCGKFFFSQIRPIFFFALLSMPLFFSFFLIYMQTSHLQELEMRFTTAMRKGMLAIDRKMKKEKFLKRYDHADPYFIDQQLESLLFLQKEKEQLNLLLEHPAFPQKRRDSGKALFSQARKTASRLSKRISAPPHG